MVIIRLQNGSDWSKANWIFRQLATDILVLFPDDQDLKNELEKAEAFGGLYLDTVEEMLASKIVDALAAVTKSTIEGKIQGWKRTRPDDAQGQHMYLKAINDLRTLIEGQSDGVRPLDAT